MEGHTVAHTDNKVLDIAFSLEPRFARDTPLHTHVHSIDLTHVRDPRDPDVGIEEGT